MTLLEIKWKIEELKFTRDMEIIRLYQCDGLSLKQIGEQAGMQSSSVNRLIRRYDEPLRNPGCPRNDQSA